MSNFRGGADNITAIVARLGKPEQDEPKTRVAAEVTLERLLGEVTGFHSGGERSKNFHKQPAQDTVDFGSPDTLEAG